MKRLLLYAFAAMLCVAAARAKVPELKGRVNDYAGLLSPVERTALERKLEEFEKGSTTQVVVLTVQSLEGETVETFAHEVFKAWGIGQKGKNNGVLLLVGRAERKVRIEVGYGLEGKLTDLVSKQILRESFVPNSKKEDWSLAIRSTADAIMKAVRGEFVATAADEGGLSDTAGFIIWLCVVAVVSLFVGEAFPRALIGFVFGGIVAAVILGGIGQVILTAVIMAFVCFILRLMLSGGSSGSSSGSDWSFGSNTSSNDSPGFSGGGGESGGGGGSDDA